MRNVSIKIMQWVLVFFATSFLLFCNNSFAIDLGHLSKQIADPPPPPR